MFLVLLFTRQGLHCSTAVLADTDSTDAWSERRRRCHVRPARIVVTSEMMRQVARSTVSVFRRSVLLHAVVFACAPSPQVTQQQSRPPLCAAGVGGEMGGRGVDTSPASPPR
ncbi:hypothetical protein BLNAU_6845 [Blattamonas nauphoetae]|uniref:Secreted protein n=1 Tax=Blattamonas nauphoetae TaxID=2049346 RepID=A0ABQ9Y330_9EUKA|nr:hypothetical protein BLNAU_6845 [Blattamonas nauphoetae]